MTTQIQSHHLAQSTDGTVVKLATDPLGAGNPTATVDAMGEHYRYSDIAPTPLSQEPTVTTFEARESSESSRREKQLNRWWRLHHGLNVNPTDAELGIDALHYWDEYAVIGENDDPLARDNVCRADAICQTLTVPSPVRERVLTLVSRTNLLAFNRHGGLDGAVIGFTVLALSEFLGYSEFETLRDTEYWPDIEQLADELAIRGSTGRQFRQLLAYVENRFGGGA